MMEQLATRTKTILDQILPHVTHVEFNTSYRPGIRELFSHTFVLPTAPLATDKATHRVRCLVQIDLHSPLRNHIISDDAQTIINWFHENPIQWQGDMRLVYNGFLVVSNTVTDGNTKITLRSSADAFL